MRIGKLQLLGLVAGAVLLGSVASVTAQESPEPGDDAPKVRMRRGGHGLGHAIRGEAVVPGSDEGTFRTVRHDRGVIASISGSTVLIEEADGHVAQVTVSEDTTIRRDGAEASLDDLEVGDQVLAVQVDDGDGFATRGLRAISAERYAQIEDRREACREDPDACRERFHRRRGSSSGDVDGSRFVPSGDVIGV